MKFHDLLIILWARRWLFILVLLITVSTTGIVSYLMPREYTASATVVIDVQSPDRIAGVVLPGMMSPGYMATQMDIITSERVAKRVVQILDLDSSPALRKEWLDETGGEGTVADWFAPSLMKGLDVQPARESHVIQIGYTGRDPQFVAQVANAFAQAYIDTNIELRTDPARKYAQWFEEQFEIQRERLVEAQNKLSEFQQQAGIVATDERLDLENQKLSELTAQLSRAMLEGSDSESKQNVRRNKDTLPEVIRNPLIIQLKTEIVRSESKLKELSGELGVNHPRYKSAKAELEEMKSRLNSETVKISDSISTQGHVSRARAEELRAEIERQKATMLQLRDQKDKIRLLRHQVDSAQRAFDAISQRLTQTQLEAQNAQSNVTVLNPASRPLRHSKPKVIINLCLAVFMGGLLAVGVSMLLELIRPVVRSSRSLEEALGMPVLAELQEIKFEKRKNQVPSNRIPKKPKSLAKMAEAS